MFVGRQLQNRLIAITAIVFCSCASDRYVGSIGARGTYSNRGFGLVLDLGQGDLAQRWQAFDPRAPENFPAEQRPASIHAPIDLDGDGILRVDETTQHHQPTLRLVTRTASTASVATASISAAQIDIDVVILGGEEAARPIDNVTRAAARELLGAEAILLGELKKRQLAPDFEARIATGRAGDRDFLLAVIDQREFYATETALIRRQAVRVLLLAPRIDRSLSNDFEAVLSGLVLSARGGELRQQEKW